MHPYVSMCTHIVSISYDIHIHILLVTWVNFKLYLLVDGFGEKQIIQDVAKQIIRIEAKYFETKSNIVSID